MLFGGSNNNNPTTFEYVATIVKDDELKHVPFAVNVPANYGDFDSIDDTLYKMAKRKWGDSLVTFQTKESFKDTFDTAIGSGDDLTLTVSEDDTSDEPTSNPGSDDWWPF